MRLFGCISALIVLLALYFPVQSSVWKMREQVRRTSDASYVLPARFTRIFAAGNDGIVSDYLLLKTITFIGERIAYGQSMQEADWHYVVQSLDVITDLDPYFLDPYVLTEGVLVWDAGMYEEANRLLRRGMEHRREDWQLPFYIGFNLFYFLKDNEQASMYLMKAASLPGSPSFLTTLAARLAYYGGKSKTALLFLRQMIDESADPRMKAIFEARLLALERATLIEDALEKYRSEKGKNPVSLSDLVSSGYLDALPSDPYGGEWVLMKSGRVFSTSKFVPHRPDPG